MHEHAVPESLTFSANYWINTLSVLFLQMTLLSCRGLELCPRWHSKWVLQTGPNRLSVWSAFCLREHFCIVLSRKKSLETQRIRITSAKLWDATPQSLQGSLNTKYWCPGVTQMTKFRVAHYLNQNELWALGFTFLDHSMIIYADI